MLDFDNFLQNIYYLVLNCKLILSKNKRLKCKKFNNSARFFAKMALYSRLSRKSHL